jgi:micrococcal nuclease
MRRALFVLVALVAAVALWRGGDGSPSSAPADGTVTRVVDGDTIHVRIDGRDESVRYIGIDTPESVKPNTPVQCFAKAAAAANERLVGGRRVRVVYDVERRDRYGRLLAYIYRDDLFVNAELVRRGFARPATYPPNVRFAERFAALAREAREAGRGLWRECSGSAPP